jgi:hypothetical protein
MMIGSVNMMLQCAGAAGGNILFAISSLALGKSDFLWPEFYKIQEIS